MLADERVLDFFGAFRLDLTLTRGEFVFFCSLIVQGVTGGRSTMSPRGKRGYRGQKCAKNNNSPGSKENHAKGPQGTVRQSMGGGYSGLPEIAT
jgi:hypothetical protein